MGGKAMAQVRKTEQGEPLLLTVETKQNRF